MVNEQVITNHYFYITRTQDTAIKLPKVTYPIGKIINGKTNVSISSSIDTKNTYYTDDKPSIQLVANFVEINGYYYSISNNISIDRSYIDYILHCIDVMQNRRTIAKINHLIIESKDIILHTKFYDIALKIPIIEKNDIYKITTSELSFEEFIKKIEFISYNQINLPNIYKIYKNIKLDPIIAKKYDEIGLETMLRQCGFRTCYLCSIFSFDYILKAIELIIIISDRSHSMYTYDYIGMVIFNLNKYIDTTPHCTNNIITAISYFIYLYNQLQNDKQYTLEYTKARITTQMNILQRDIDSCNIGNHYTQIAKMDDNTSTCYTLGELARYISGIDLINKDNTTLYNYTASYRSRLNYLIKQISTRYPHI